ncbi:MAG: hypothetical protein KGJ94_11240 [Xanthomonadaceae bacterium]|nr:hypothetical protein [Xanthomonadaceae bacterium]
MSNLPQADLHHLPDDAAIASRARAVFRDACEHADSYHALRLGLARRKSLNARGSHAAVRVWLPLAGAAACCAVVAAAWLHPATRIRAGATSTIASSAPIVASQDVSDELIPEVGSSQMEMVQDLDFYRWLAAQPDVAAAGSGGRN